MRFVQGCIIPDLPTRRLQSGSHSSLRCLRGRGGVAGLAQSVIQPVFSPEIRGAYSQDLKDKNKRGSLFGLLILLHAAQYPQICIRQNDPPCQTIWTGKK
ncbi:hypothetical protein Pst134EA_025438 [Puccinia striiformis f. sp. tritici]|uniref:hypothetical protein n=1 Tax=Puccinia striiformis f. sp. tritici TaxID=168172 RepID=UPI002007F740|nr:hypothetical protein Pst134EA_025438 [Puccinia striiformis f. sp. tritici]KAH9451483.1 hypothetical protein Pst134EA_025438 [Puccinia striiformis f. sp. tritici]